AVAPPHNAEDPDRDFAPSPGRITRLALPSGPGIRVDTGFSEGDAIPADFDSMIAKIIAHGRDRTEALARLRRAMTQTTVIIEGGVTNKGFVRMLLDEPAVIDGSADTGWIDRVRAQGALVSHRHSAIALIAAAVEAYEDEEAVTRQRFLSTAHGGRPQSQHDSGRALELKLRDVGYRVQVARIGGHRFRIGISAGGPEHAADVGIERFDEHSGQITVNGVRFKVVTSTHGPIHLVEVDGVTHRISRDEGGIVRSPVPALVVATPLQVGDEVEAGAPLLVVESMKMETVLRAPFRGRVRELAVSLGSQVEAGARLLRLEPLGDGDEAAGPAAAAKEAELDLPSEPVDVPAAERAARALQDLRSLLLGFDIDPRDDKRLLADYLAARAELVAEGGHELAGEVELLRLFADLSELSRNRPAGEESKSASSVHSPREYFHTYLRYLDSDRSGLSDSFQQRLTQVLSRYGVEGLDRTPELEDAVFRIFLAQQRAAADVAVVTALLRQWVNEAPPAEADRVTVGLALEHLVAATQVRFPAVADLARGVVFAWFAQPLLRRTRAKVYTAVRKHLRHLDHHPDAPDRAERISAMVASPEPLVRLVGRRIGREGTDPVPLLEVLSRRYYGNRALSDIRVSKAVGCTFVVADHLTAAGGGRVVTTAVDFLALAQAVKAVDEFAGDGALVADLYLTWSDGPSDPDEMATRLREVLAAQQPSDRIDRITTTVAGNSGAVMHHHFTFRPSADGFVEERLLRGLHPRIAERMQLERLRDFDLTRLPSPDEEVYLFRAAARQNPSDERLVALGQVRDLTPLRDDEGRLVALPAAEDILATCLDAIRRAKKPGAKTSATNRIVIYVWPPTDLSPDDLNTVARRVLPTTAGAGLEEVLFLGRRRDSATGELVDIAVRIGYDMSSGVQLSVGPPPTEPIEPLDDYRQDVLRAHSRGTHHPYELTGMLAGPSGSFTEYDLDEHSKLVPVDRPKGRNTAALVAGVVSTPTPRHPEGMTRVVLLGDPTKALGALSEPECARVIAALDLAERMRVPLEWFALSAGARISMSSGTENMDWVAAALKRIVNFTQDGGEINVVVAGINVGAQPYWNAEATMLMHTKGILVMTPDSAMVLTGKQSLDFSGGVSAEDNHGIGGYDRIMGPNGQAQYWAPDIRGAREILMSHYDHSYVAP
ncbi:biotin/lipoyl-containing protein, partial [Streptosporangium sp. NPDC003464]